MAGSCDDIKLLLSCQVDKLNRITGNTDREVCVLRFLRMFHRVLQLIKTEYIHVEMMSTLIDVYKRQEYNDEMIREAIHRELGRGGQVYYCLLYTSRCV